MKILTFIVRSRRGREWKNAWKSGKAAAGCLYGAICIHVRKFTCKLQEKLRHTPFAWISGVFTERAEVSFVLDFWFFSSRKRIKPFDNSQQDSDVDVSGWLPGIYIAVVYRDVGVRGKAKFLVR